MLRSKQSRSSFCMTPRGRNGRHFLHVVKRKVVWRSLLTGLKWSSVSFCGIVIKFDLGHGDDSMWQMQHFGGLGFIFRGRHSTL